VRAQIPIEDERLNIEIIADSDLPKIYVNKIRVVRALINLIENAIVVPHMHDFKEIKIEVMKKGDDVQIIITDNGIGISKEKLDKIWITGYSMNQTSGLGLSFAKKVIEDNEGTIELESESGIGTVVTVSFPGHAS
jgi:signal transduction histidine kinase